MVIQRFYVDVFSIRTGFAQELSHQREEELSFGGLQRFSMADQLAAAQVEADQRKEAHQKGIQISKRERDTLDF